MDVALRHPPVVRSLVSSLRGAARSPCCTARAVAIDPDQQSFAAAGLDLVRTRWVRAISCRHASLARAVHFSARLDRLCRFAARVVCCAQSFRLLNVRPDEAFTIIFFTPPTAHQRYSGRGNCYALSGVSDVEIVTSETHELLFIRMLLSVLPEQTVGDHLCDVENRHGEEIAHAANQ